MWGIDRGDEIFLNGKKVSIDLNCTLLENFWWYNDLATRTIHMDKELDKNIALNRQNVMHYDELEVEYRYDERYIKCHIENYKTVSKEGLCLENVMYQTYEICKSGIVNDPLAIKYTKNQKEELCELAIRSLPRSIMAITNANLYLRRLAVSLEGTLIDHILDKYYNGVEKCEEALELSMIAVKRDGWAIFSIPDPSYELILEAVSTNGMVICDLHPSVQTEEMCEKAVGQYAWAYEYCKFRTDVVKMAAVNNCGMILGKIKEQSYELCRAAYDNCRESLRFVRNPTHYEMLIAEAETEAARM